jgi:predicted nuclease of predicted toxin-antitoxin system
MNFIADEGVDIQIVQKLREAGHDVIYIAELASGTNDEDILQMASDGYRILITRDKDFGELAYRDGRAHAGIILSRLHELSSEKKAALVLKTIQDFNSVLTEAFTVLQPGKIRIRKMK